MSTGSAVCPSALTAPMPLPDGKGDIEIGKGALVASFRPSAGGRMSRLSHRDFGDILVPMTPAAFDPLTWPKAGAYPLFPFHNRVVGGLLHHRGETYRLKAHPAVAPDALHGPAHRRAWQVTEQGPDRIGMALDYRPDEDWPFAFRARQHIVLGEDFLTIRLLLENTGESVMPGGMGWHPFLDVSMAAPAMSDAAIDCPVDEAGVPTELRVARTQSLLPAEPFTAHVEVWTCAEAQTRGGAVVTITATPGLAHLVCHRMPDYLCLEPASHRAGIFRISARGLTAQDIALIDPGAQIAETVTLRFRPAD
jgi:aldose 1-epimerase